MPLPWLMQPVLPYSSRDPGECMLTPAQCQFKAARFRNWYVADLVYARGTVYFFLVALVVCVAGWAALAHSPAAVRSRPWWHRITAAFRFGAYRRYEVRALRTRTPAIGVMVLLGLGGSFLALMVLAPQPYYWPSDAAYGESPPLGTRSGWLALGALPFLLLFATKASPIAKLAGVSHERLIVFHIWLGWAVFVLALVHTFPFIVYNERTHTSAEMWDTMSFYWTGVIAIIAQAYLTFMSIPWMRNRYYEFFKATHYFVAIVFMVFLFIHCDFTLTSLDYFFAAGALYGVPWAYSQMKTYFDHGVRRRATITSVHPDCLRVDIPVGPFTLWTPGQHMFLRFLSDGPHALTAHPFTICSLPDSDKLVGEPKSVMTFYVQPRGGITRRLAAAASGSAAASRANASVTLPVLLEGAYGGVQGRPLTSYDRSLVIACGAGAGFSLPFVMAQIAAAARSNTSARKFRDAQPASAESDDNDSNNNNSNNNNSNNNNNNNNKRHRQKLTVVLATRDTTITRWYEAALTEFLHQQMLDVPTEGLIDIWVYLTRPPPVPEAEADAPLGDVKGDDGWADDERLRPSKAAQKLGMRVVTGRPDLAAVVRDFTMTGEGEAVGIAVCGPVGVLAAVQREAAEAERRIMQSGPGAREVYLHSEVFGW